MLVALAAGSARAGPEAPPESEFVGSAACGACHEDVYAIWRETPHARASESLEGYAGRAACQSCHATGAAPASPASFAGVGCEACHGPGSGYAPADIMRNPPLARALGLRDLSTPEARAAACARCHGEKRTRLLPFDAEDAWERIAH